MNVGSTTRHHHITHERQTSLLVLATVTVSRLMRERAAQAVRTKIIPASFHRSTIRSSLSQGLWKSKVMTPHRNQLVQIANHWVEVVKACPTRFSHSRTSHQYGIKNGEQKQCKTRTHYKSKRLRASPKQCQLHPTHAMDYSQQTPISQSSKRSCSHKLIISRWLRFLWRNRERFNFKAFRMMEVRPSSSCKQRIYQYRADSYCWL